ncbi:unnamed protein product [marine sediment metagenome]|uniref:Uncharacterized protein n=1 Tax=marine sediment metagenome TaxID=412755 RepID=X1JSB2_9ZZZZ
MRLQIKNKHCFQWLKAYIELLFSDNLKMKKKQKVNKKYHIF